jgi:hypothetical protein
VTAAAPDRHPDARTPTRTACDLEQAHRYGVSAAVAGLSDAGLGGSRLTGPLVPVLAEAAVTSATPFLRAPLLARISGALRLHPVAGTESGLCPTCGVSAPCPTARELRRGPGPT